MLILYILDFFGQVDDFIPLVLEYLQYVADVRGHVCRERIHTSVISECVAVCCSQRSFLVDEPVDFMLVHLNQVGDICLFTVCGSTIRHFSWHYCLFRNKSGFKPISNFFPQILAFAFLFHFNSNQVIQKVFFQSGLNVGSIQYYCLLTIPWQCCLLW